MRTVDFPFERLQCRPVVGEYAATQGWKREELELGGSDLPVQIAHARYALYMPSLRLTVVDQSVVPSESTQGAWGWEFHRRQPDFNDAGMALQGSVDAVFVRDEVCVLTNFFSTNFYKWITEELIKVVVLERAGYRGKYLAVGLREYAYEFLELLGVPPERIIANAKRPMVFADCIQLTQIWERCALDHRRAYGLLRERLLQTCTSSGVRTAERLWMIRRLGAFNGRSDIVNSEEVEAVLGRYGFEMVDMAALPLPSQIRMANGARIMAGLHGAAFAHSLFMEPRSKVVECFSPTHLNPGIINFCRLMRHDYSMLVPRSTHGRHPGGEEVIVDCNQLELALQDCDAG